MKMATLLIPAVVTLTACGSQAHAQADPLTVAQFAALGQTTTWTCTYPNWVGGKTVIKRYRVVGNEVVEDTGGIHYQILQNNDYGLVAVFSESSIDQLLLDPTHKGPVIEAFMLVIDKGTREMKLDIIVMGDKNPVLPRSGTCIPG